MITERGAITVLVIVWQVEFVTECGGWFSPPSVFLSLPPCWRLLGFVILSAPRVVLSPKPLARRPHCRTLDYFRFFGVGSTGEHLQKHVFSSTGSAAGESLQPLHISVLFR